jgi:sigma-B regulation protein RsbU (phosphoserine phosphatase)
MYYLIVHAPGLPSRTIWLNQARQTIGRSSRADINIIDSFASRVHAVLERRGNVYWLKDLGSQNGTFYNNTRMGQDCQMFPGDRIKIGETELLYCQEPSDDTTGSRSRVVFNNERSTGPEFTLGPEPGLRVSRVLVNSTQVFAERQLQQQVANAFIDDAKQRNLLGLVSKVGLVLADWSLDQLLENILDIVFEQIPADRGFLLLIDEASNELVCQVARYRVPPASGETPEVSISRHISDLVMQQQSVLTSNAQMDSRFAGAESVILSGLRSCMAVPVALKEQVLGMIYLDNPYEQRFSQTDLQVLTAIASVAAIKIEQSKYLAQEMERRRIEQELELAATIQRRILPQESPTLENIDIIAVNVPCNTVGGDYYDFLPVTDKMVGFCIADVSGKGIPAALLVSTLQATFWATMEQPPLTSAISRINKVIFRSTPSYNYITFFYGLLNRETQVLQSINAGHNAPIIVRQDGQIVRLNKGGCCLGLFENAQFEIEETQLAPGDTILLYTDGVTEAANLQEEEFGEARLITLLQNYRALPLGEISRRLYRAIEDFVGEAPQHDDLTYLIFRLNANNDFETIVLDIPDEI